MSLKQAADYLATKGRNGDDQMLHVSGLEVAFLEGLAGQPLTTNPDTGQKEAFFFLAPLFGALGSLFGGGAAAAGAGAGTAAATSAAAAAAAAKAAAATTAASSGLGTLGMSMKAVPEIASLTSLAPKIGADALAAGTIAPATTAATSAAPSSLLSMSGAHSALAPSTVPGITLPATAPIPTTSPGIGSAMTTSVGGKVPLGLGGAGSPGALAGGPWGAGAAPGAGAAGTGAFPGAAAPAAATASEKGLLGGLGSLFGGNGTQMLQMAGLASMMMGGGGGGSDDDDDDSSPNAGKEKYKGGDPRFPDKNYKAGLDPEWDYFPGYASGGLVKMAKGGKVPGMSKGDDKIVEDAVMALQGRSKNPDEAIQTFVQTFGPEALQDLMAKMGIQIPQQGPQVQGQQAGTPDGMNDGIGALIDGQQPAALSEGEYVVPSDVVSGLGNGSTDAGARVLDGMRDRARAMRGQPQPQMIDPNQAMPV